MDSPLPSALTDPKPGPTPPAWLPGFTLTQPPPGFVDDPYPFYAQLRQHAPVHAIGTASVLLTRYEDVIAVYRHPAASSDKQREFAPMGCTGACCRNWA